MGASGRQVLPQDSTLYSRLRPGPGAWELYCNRMFLWRRHRYVNQCLLLCIQTSCFHSLNWTGHSSVCCQCACRWIVFGKCLEASYTGYVLEKERVGPGWYLQLFLLFCTFYSTVYFSIQLFLCRTSSRNSFELHKHHVIAPPRLRCFQDGRRWLIGQNSTTPRWD